MSKLLRRGFKAEAERRALRIRRQLGLSGRDRLDPQDLADHLGVYVIPLTDLTGDVKAAASIDRMLAPRAGFSAVTVCVGERRLIVYNPRHPDGRRANSLAHELSHIVMGHEPKPALGPWGCRDWDEVQEAEADWQAAALLVPREGAFWWMEPGRTIAAGAAHFGVSEALFRWRVNQTGVIRQLEARRRRRPSFSDSLREATKQFGRRGARSSSSRSETPGHIRLKSGGRTSEPAESSNE